MDPHKVVMSNMKLPQSPIYMVGDEQVTMAAGLVIDCYCDFMQALDYRLEIETWIKQNGRARYNAVMNSAHKEYDSPCYRIRMLFESVEDAIYIKLKYGG